MKGKFGCMTRKIKNKSNYIKWGLLILFVMAVIFFTAYFFGMMLFVEGKIVEDRPLWELACKARPLCHTWNTALSCSGPAYNIDEVIENGKLNDYYLAKQISSESYELASWEGYNGCNESTNGFFKDENIGKVDTSICACKSILS